MSVCRLNDMKHMAYYCICRL